MFKCLDTFRCSYLIKHVYTLGRLKLNLFIFRDPTSLGWIMNVFTNFTWELCKIDEVYTSISMLKVNFNLFFKDENNLITCIKIMKNQGSKLEFF